MKRLIVLIVAGVLTGGCAHQDLKAPCASLASTDPVPCDQPIPIGFAYVNHRAD